MTEIEFLNAEVKWLVDRLTLVRRRISQIERGQQPGPEFVVIGPTASATVDVVRDVK